MYFNDVLPLPVCSFFTMTSRNTACIRSLQTSSKFSAAVYNNHVHLSSFSKFHQGPASTTPARMWNMFSCYKKKFFFILSGIFFHVSVSWTSWPLQPLNTQIDFPAVSNGGGREEMSKNTDCFGSFLTVIRVCLIGNGSMCTLYWQTWELDLETQKLVPVLVSSASHLNGNGMHWSVMKSSFSEPTLSGEA